MSFAKRYICCLLLLQTCIAARAQQNNAVVDSLPIETLGVKDGLSQGLVSGIVQDKDGFLWFGTKDGLNKYDGYHFTIYRHEKDNPYSLPGNYISHMVEDDHGNFWVGTATGGLCLFDRKKERFYPVSLPDYNPHIANNNVNPRQYQKGMLMVLSEKLRIYDVSHIRPGHYEQVVLTAANICLDEVNTVGTINAPGQSLYTVSHWLNDLSLWVNKNDSIVVYRPNATGAYKQTNGYSMVELGLRNNVFYDIASLDQPNQFVFTDDKELAVYDFSKKKIVCKQTFNNGAAGPIDCKDKWGNLIIRLEENHFLFNSTHCLLTFGKGQMNGKLDRNGIMWMGTAGSGVIKYDYRKQLFRKVALTHFLYQPPNFKGELLMQNPDKVPEWLNPYTRQKRSIFQRGVWQKDWIIHAITQEKDGTGWLKLHSGKTGQFKNFSLLYEVDVAHLYKAIDARYQSHFKDQDNDLWFSFLDKNRKPGLAHLNKKTLQLVGEYFFPAKPQNDYNIFVTGHWQDARGVFWFSTYQGLFSLNPKNQQWQHWQNIPSNATSLSSNQLLSILPDPKQPNQYLWLGTEGAGLDRFEIATGKCMHYTEKDGLPNNVVYGLLSDQAGNIWMSTNRGLSCFSPLSPDLTPDPSPFGEGRFRNFSTEDGLPGDEYNRYEYFKMPNGDLLFGGIEGGVIFNPEKILEKEPAPAVVFTGLSVFNKPVDYKIDSNIISLPIAYASVITLPHDKGMFTISFAALEFTPADKKKYRYYLDGYDKQWIDGGNKNEATYTNLSPGTYTFHVTACGRDGVWNEQGKTIDIVILPAWYQTIWFKALVLLLIAGGLYGWYRYRLAQEIKVLNIRNQIAHDLHDEIGSTLSSISISSSVIQRKVQGSNDEAYNMLKQISKNTDNMMESMSDIVWTISTRNDSFESLVNRMRAFAIEILDPYDILFHLDVNEQVKAKSLNMVQRKNLYLIFKEAINNAAKYAGCENVYVTIAMEGNKLQMTVNDDGCGFDTTEKENEVKTKSMGGNGMHAMKKRADEMKGKLKIESTKDKGTTVTIVFPLKSEQ